MVNVVELSEEHCGKGLAFWLIKTLSTFLPPVSCPEPYIFFFNTHMSVFIFLFSISVAFNPPSILPHFPILDHLCQMLIQPVYYILYFSAGSSFYSNQLLLLGFCRYRRVQIIKLSSYVFNTCILCSLKPLGKVKENPNPLIAVFWDFWHEN